jgi:site-specific recombinase XerD
VTHLQTASPAADPAVEPPSSAAAVLEGWYGPAGDALAQATAAWLASKKPTTREAYHRDLRSWAAFCAARGTHVLTARKPDADLFGAYLQDPAAAARPLSATSAARRMAAVSSWYRYLVACDVHDRNPFAAAERPRVDRDYSATAWLDEAGARRMIEAAEAGTGTVRLRDAAMVRLMLQLGIRVSEVCSLQISALGAARGQRTVTISGKGGKRVARALPPAAAVALDAYLAERAERTGVGVEQLSGALFTTSSGRAVDRVEVFRLVRRLAERAGLAHPQSVTPHALRHTFATIATERGADLDDLQDAMGHADPRTTRRYQRAARRLERDPAHLVAAALG